MKYTAVVAVISLAYLFFFLHSCHGILCYFCHSLNYTNPKCENITDDKYLFDYGDYAKFCLRIISTRSVSENVTERLLRRAGYTDISYPDELMTEEKERGFKPSIVTCKEDRCNG